MPFFLKKQDIAQECSAPANSIQQSTLAQLDLHHIYIRQIDTPTWCLFFYKTSSLLRRRWRQVVRPPSGFVVVFVMSPNLPPARPSSSSGRSTFLRLRRRPRQVARPSSGSVFVLVRSLDLPPASSSSSSGRSTFLRLCRRPRQVARPSSGSFVVFVRSLDLPPASSSLLSGR
jgi:hypothetical protein